MPISAKFSGRFGFLADAATRVGIYVGLSLSLIFTIWLGLANRVPWLEAFAMPRNLVAASLLLLSASFPLFRFFRSPSELLLSSLLGWGIFTFTYGLLCLKFILLDQHYSTFHLFVLGAIVYSLLATLCWIGTIIWKVHGSSHPRH